MSQSLGFNLEEELRKLLDPAATTPTQEIEGSPYFPIVADQVMAGANSAIDGGILEALTPAVLATQRQQQAEAMNEWQPVGEGIFRKGDPAGPNRKGIAEYTNVVDSEGRPTMDPKGTRSADYYRSGSSYALSKQEGLVNTNFESALRSIEAAPDMASKLSMFSSLQTSSAQQIAMIQQDLQQQANTKIGVDKLEKLLADNEAADRAHPMWMQMQSDSEETARVRTQLSAARSQAMQLASQFAQTNPQLTTMTNQLKIMEVQLNRQLATDQRLTEKEAQFEMRNELKKQEIIQSYRPQAFDRLRKIDDSIADRSNEELVNMLAGGKKTLGADVDMVLKASDPELLQLTLMRNQAAAKVFITEQAEKYGVSEQELKQRITKLENTMTPNRILDNMRMQGVSEKDPTYSGFKTLAAQVTSGVATKEQNAQYQQRLYDLASQMLRMENTNTWAGDVTGGKWQFEDPRIKESVTKLEKNGKVSIYEVAQDLSSSLDRKEWAGMADQMRKEIFRNQKEGLLTATDAEMLYTQVQQEFVRSRLGSVFKAFPDAWDNTSKLMGPNLQQQAYQWLFSSPQDK